MRVEKSPKASQTGNLTNDEVGSSTVDVELPPELIKKLTAVLKASGQSKADWIRDAIAEAISR